MNEIHFSWTGSEESEEGVAYYSRGGVKFLTLDLPSFKQAHSISLALNAAMIVGYRKGVKEAEDLMNTAMRGLMK